jgi:hypothetical protein
MSRPGHVRSASATCALRTRAALLAAAFALLVLPLLVAGCSQGETDQQKLNSVMVGSDTVLPTADTDAVSAIGVQLAALAQPLQQWWSTLNDPSVTPKTWLAAAPGLLDQIRTDVDNVESRLTPDRDERVRDTYQPYVSNWRDVVTALETLRDKVAAGDTAGQQAATDDFNNALARIHALDEARVKRVATVLGVDQARRLLQEEGVDPSRFGIPAN